MYNKLSKDEKMISWCEQVRASVKMWLLKTWIYNVIQKGEIIVRYYESYREGSAHILVSSSVWLPVCCVFLMSSILLARVCFCIRAVLSWVEGELWFSRHWLWSSACALSFCMKSRKIFKLLGTHPRVAARMNVAPSHKLAIGMFSVCMVLLLCACEWNIAPLYYLSLSVFFYSQGVGGWP